MRQPYEFSVQFLDYTGYYATGYDLRGFSSNMSHFHLDPASYEYMIGSDFHLDNVSCTGNETKLSECMYAEVGVPNCKTGAGVICTGEYQCQLQLCFSE